MTYIPTKPDAGPSPFVDASTIQTNFQQFGIIFANNHKALNKFGQGDHTTVILENQASDPGITTSLVALYNKNAGAATGGPQPQLFFQIPKFLPTQYDTSNIPNVGMQLTYNTVNTSGPTQYQSFLPGGYIIYFGSTMNAAIPITLSPVPSNLIVANATMTTTTGGGVPFSVSTSINSASQFTINTNATGAYTILWFAIAGA